MSDNDQELYKSHTMNDSSESKQDIVYQQIKEDILNNTYPEGTLMVERKLSEIYNVSRSPIRKALQQLTHEGLLTFVPGSGVTVAGFTIEDILEVYDLIEIMQSYAVRTCINKFEKPEITTLGEFLVKMRHSLDEENLLACTRHDQHFHEYLISESGNKRLETIYSQLDVQSMRFIATILEDFALAERSYTEHMEIYHYIENKDADAAEKAMRNHYQNIRQYYVNKLISRLNV